MSLVKKLVSDFGNPRSFEEMAIYDRNDSGLRIIITRNGIDVSWGTIEKRSDTGKRQKRISMSCDGLKDKLDFLLDGRNHECDIGICSVLEFHDYENNILLNYRSQTFVGNILSFEALDSYSESEIISQILMNSKKKYAGYIAENLKEKIDKIDKDKENCFSINTAYLSLNSKITDFCRRNGINNTSGKPYSYRELIKSKTNDYGRLESFFKNVTNMDLLSEDSTYRQDIVISEKVSIIIPFFNSHSSINYVLKSIYGQDNLKLLEGGLEIIVVDDGSVNRLDIGKLDISHNIEIRVVNLDPNEGVSHARKMGVAHSTGSILIFLDSDIIIPKSYIYDHVARCSVLGEAIFVSFKQNIDTKFAESLPIDKITIDCADYSNDLRVNRIVDHKTPGIRKIDGKYRINILEESNYFKDFHGSRIFGVYDLPSMIIGHNFSCRRSLIEKMSPFSRIFQGWGLEDTYFGLRAIAEGAFIIPVLSSGVYHIDHPVRSGSVQEKEREFQRNAKILEYILDQPANRLLTDGDRRRILKMLDDGS